jgi:hypothetical protein
MDTNVFMDKAKKPDNTDLKSALNKTYILWTSITEYVNSKNLLFINEWYYPGVKYGWAFRIKNSKRTIVYLLPRKNYFKVAFVFGQKATDIILQSNLSDEIKLNLKSARVYAEGRGIRIEIKSKTILKDIKKLIDIKLLN